MVFPQGPVSIETARVAWGRVAASGELLAHATGPNNTEIPVSGQSSFFTKHACIQACDAQFPVQLTGRLNLTSFDNLNLSFQQTIARSRPLVGTKLDTAKSIHCNSAHCN